ncbi:MAG: PadR family transcriptional regulator [Rhodospirillaceae bacterium]|nr:PadR family transcriptional regulator [Rhodospirillaceae bacterium]
MRHGYRNTHPNDPSDHHDNRHHAGHHGPHRGGRRGGRVFDYGELRLLLLAMIAERPCHGYELIKAIEERFGGSYSPSPGVIYPTLAWLDDMGYATIEAAEGGRKCYRITAEGEAFLVANRQAADALLARVGHGGAEPPPAPVIRAMENLKLALRLRLQRGPIDQATAESIAAALDAAAQTVERSA